MPQIELDVPSSICPPTRTLKPEALSTLSQHANESTTQCFLLSHWTHLDRSVGYHVPKVFRELEFPCTSLLASIESYGFAVNIPHLLECREKLVDHAQLMERVAHRLSGRLFRLDSPKEISQVLFQWLRLPQLTDAPDHIVAKQRSRLTLFSGRRVLSSRSSSLPRATNTLLLRLSAFHPLPSLIIEWRHIHGVLEKSFASLVSACTLAANDSMVIRPRLAFCAPEHSVLISGDFCQLELRLLAHFSRDANLLDLLAVPESAAVDTRLACAPPPPEQDAFRKLAAHWLKLSSAIEVTPSQRQQAKQLCYALIYGMGAQGLSSQLDITEGDAQNMIDSFLRAFPGIQSFISDTIQSAHRTGRISTLNGRVRILKVLEKPTNLFQPLGERENNMQPSVRSRSQDVRQHFAVAKAERQAVNTVIQGSAAEIAKSAMLAVERRLVEHKGRCQCRLVLHEHDELLYEVTPAHAAPEIGSLIRATMSSTGSDYKLTVPLPIKLRAGQNWAQLDEVVW
ncbi:DNA polymerase theta [Fasciolopsis buskii]|uniref:DNA-directed DNA polymerase n=1 Tax=Fasciolopsis buskii TaxID=27845 RepID=A0A8E0RSD3_9TREM|nr:DNA polymerase theta [Fasciolopsis buski]